MWRPPEAILEQVKTLLSTREQLIKQSIASQNALQTLTHKVVRTYVAEETLRSTWKHWLKEQIQKIDEAIKNLLKNNPTLHDGVLLLLSIPSVGWLMAAHWAVLSHGFKKTLEPTASRVLFGNMPLRTYQWNIDSTSRDCSRHVGPPAEIRKLIHLAARTLRVHHTLSCGRISLRKVGGGKAKTLVLNNIANRLLRIICAVLRDKKPYIAGHRSMNPLVLKNV